MRAQSSAGHRQWTVPAERGVWTHRGAPWAPGLKGCAQGFRRHRGTVLEDLGLLDSWQGNAGLQSKRHGVGITLLIGTTDAVGLEVISKERSRVFPNRSPEWKSPSLSAMGHAGSW